MKFYILLVFLIPPVFAESNQPYIDHIKSKLQKEDQEQSPDSNETYLEKEKAKLLNDTKKKKSLGYSKALQDELKSKEKDESQVESFIENQKKQLEPVESGGAIQAFKEGRSELKLKRSTDISWAVSTRIGTVFDRNVLGSTGSGVGNFEDTYGADWAPDVFLTIERQILRAEKIGSLGFAFTTGFSMQSGYGSFLVTLLNPANAEEFPRTSETRFRFITIPALAGGVVRLNPLWILRPFATASAGYLLFTESRNDDGKDYKGKSAGVYFTGGMNLLIDWVNRKQTFESYSTSGIKHTYLTMEYSQFRTFSEEVLFDVSGFYSGITFEF